MWKQLADLMAQFFTLARDIQQNKTDIKEVREELKATQQEVRQLAAVVERLMYEVHRSNERTESDREKDDASVGERLAQVRAAASARQSTVRRINVKWQL